MGEIKMYKSQKKNARENNNKKLQAKLCIVKI